MLLDVDISTPEGGPIAFIRNIEPQRAVDQIMGWVEQGLNVALRQAGTSSSLNPDLAAQENKDNDEIISRVVLDIEA